MSAAGAAQAQTEAAVQRALDPVLAAVAALTDRVAELEKRLSPAETKVTPRRGTAAKAQHAEVRVEANP